MHDEVMKAAAWGVLIALLFVGSGRFLISLRNVVDTHPTPIQSAVVVLNFLCFFYSGWWLFKDVIAALLGSPFQ